MVEIFTERFRQIWNLYLQPGHSVGAPVRTVRQVKYLPRPFAVPDLDQTFSGARLDCERDLHKQLIKYGKAVKVWITVLVQYEAIYFLANKTPFEQYLSAAPTRIFQQNGIVHAYANPYIDLLQILTDRFREFNAKFIRDKSHLRLARVLQFTLKMVKSAPYEGRGWQPLPDFLSNKKTIIKI